MKTLLTTLVALTAAWPLLGLGASAPEPPPCGDYLEARTASVWCGPCHHAGELFEMGRHGLVAWSFDGGSFRGTDLTNVRVIALLDGEGNLGEPSDAGEVTVRVLVDSDHGEAAAVASAWVEERLQASVASTAKATIVFERDGDDLALDVPGVLSVEGQALANRACCSQPETRWYAPFDACLGATVVGVANVCEVRGSMGSTAWSFIDANNLQVGTFGPVEG